MLFLFRCLCNKPRASRTPLLLHLSPLRELIHNLLVTLVRRRLALLVLPLLSLQQLLHREPERVRVQRLLRLAQRKSPRSLVHAVQLRLADPHDLPVDVLLLVVVVGEARLPVPQVDQPRLPQQAEVEALEPQVVDPLQAVLAEVLQVRVEQRHLARLLDDQEPSRERATKRPRLLLRVRPAGVRNQRLVGGEREPVGQRVLLEVTGCNNRDIHALIAQIAAGLGHGAHAEIVLGQREKAVHSRVNGKNRDDSEWQSNQWGQFIV